MSEDLIAFVKARLDEDEAAAKACADSGGSVSWRDSLVQASGDHTIRTAGNRPVARIRLADSKARDGRTLNPDACAVHIARHDPARVLREVAAMRAIAAMHHRPDQAEADEYTYSEAAKFCRFCGPGDSWEAREHPGWFEVWPCTHARLIAAVWSGHPDYRPEWTP